MSADEIFNSCVLFEDDFVLEEISPDLDPEMIENSWLYFNSRGPFVLLKDINRILFWW